MSGFKSVLVVVVDESAASRASLREAAAVAERDGADITVVQVVEPLPDVVAGHVPGPSRLDVQERMVAMRFHHLNDWARRLLNHRIERVTSAVLVGTPFLEIIRRVEREGHDLVVIVGEPGSSSRLSSTALHLLRKCPAPVWVLRSSGRSSMTRIGAALADDRDDPTRRELNRNILSSAVSLAKPRGAEVFAVHAWHVPDEDLVRKVTGLSKARADALVSAVRSDARTWLGQTLRSVNTDGVRVTAALVKGPAGQQLPRFGARHRLDLVVMGTVTDTRVPGLIMSETAEDIAQHVHCGILALKPPGFVSPVPATT